MESKLSRIKEMAQSESEIRLAEYFTHYPEIVRDASLKDISDHLYISGSSIIRYLKKCGYSGFSDFKYDIRSSLKHSIEAPDNYQKIIQSTTLQLSELLPSIDQGKLSEIVHLITSKSPVFIHGRGLSNIASDYLYNNLLSLDIPCIQHIELNFFRNIANQGNDNSLIIIFSQDTIDKEYLETVRKLKENNVPIILITCEFNRSQSMQYCDYIFHTNDKRSIHHGVDVNTRIGFLLIAQLIIDLTSLAKKSAIA